MNRLFRIPDSKSSAGGLSRVRNKSAFALVITCLALIGCSDGDGKDQQIPPPIEERDLVGVWTISEQFTGSAEFSDMLGSGTLELTIVEGTLRGTWRSVDTLVGSSGHQSVTNFGEFPVQFTESDIEFSFTFNHYPFECSYSAGVSRDTVLIMRGSIECPEDGLDGTWEATFGTPQFDRLPTVSRIDVAEFATCAVSEDGRVFCWGPNMLAVLGSGDTVPRIVPGPSVEAHAFTRVSLSPGGSHACGISDSGQAYCWGNQEGGRLGDGVTAAAWQYVTEPTAVLGAHSFQDIAAGGDHVCAIANDGAAYCWGHNYSGQLGTGDFSDYPVPQPVAGGIRFKSITAHQSVTCAVSVDDDAYCWGDGWSGNLGNGSTSISNVPVPVSGGLKFTSLELSLFAACGVSATSEGYCWGSNFVGELGLGYFSEVEPTPRKVTGNLAWKVISPGIFVSCGVTTNDRGYCWGGNLSGERGDGDFPAADRPVPEPVSGEVLFESINTDWHTCGVSLDGSVYCWGPGELGSVGDGLLTSRGVPTLVEPSEL